MKIHAFICSRDTNHSKQALNLFSYLSSCGITVHNLIGEKSIFEAYSREFSKLELADHDIIIFCHDDIEILLPNKIFLEVLLRSLMPKEVGFVGPAGTAKLSGDAIWWNQVNWRDGWHKGVVWHGNNLLESQCTYYGPCGRVVVLDGLFIAAKARTLRTITKHKPAQFSGDWDFYDIWYTMQAHLNKFHNMVVPINILHNSFGELAGRDSWHANRQAFIETYTLPIALNNG